MCSYPSISLVFFTVTGAVLREKKNLVLQAHGLKTVRIRHVHLIVFKKWWVAKCRGRGGGAAARQEKNTTPGNTNEQRDHTTTHITVVNDLMSRYLYHP